MNLEIGDKESPLTKNFEPSKTLKNVITIIINNKNNNRENSLILFILFFLLKF